MIGITNMALLFTAPKISFCWYTVSLAGQRVDVKATALKIYPKNQMVSLMKHTVEVMIPEAEIKARIAELGRRLMNATKTAAVKWCWWVCCAVHLCLWLTCAVRFRCRMKSTL